jgi:hypothetical protein
MGGEVRVNPDETEGRASPLQSSGRTDKHPARTLEDVSHLFLSEQNAGSGTPSEAPEGSARRIGMGTELLKRALADLTLDNLILKKAAERLKELEKENELLRQAVADLTLDNLILKQEAKGRF